MHTSPPPGAVLAATVTCVSQDLRACLDVILILFQSAALGFVPVAIRFQFFTALAQIAKPATSQQITDFCNELRTEQDKEVAPLCMYPL
jgi:hypothetical protein